MSVISEEKLIAKLENKAYREAYVCEHIKTSVPLQIRHLREQRKLTQAELAKQAKTTQTVISRLEDPNYGNLTLNSLLKIATGLDVALLVKFVSFTKLLSEFQDLSLKALSVKSFTEELAMLKSWASVAKNAKSQVRRSEGSIRLEMAHTANTIASLKETEQYAQIQAQLLKPQLPYQLPTHIVTTTSMSTSAIVNIPSMVGDFRDLVRIPSSITSRDIGQTIEGRSILPSKISVDVYYQWLIGKNYHLSQTNTLEVPLS